MDKLFYNVSFETSRLVTKTYSTSFTVGVRCLDACIRDAIYSIYGFVRLADEIVDTFHEYDKELLLDEFEEHYYRSLEKGISLNPVLNSFAQTVITYKIPDELVRAFLKSMRDDLYQSHFNEEELSGYIYGSAEVVGLMCLCVFVNGDEEEYNRLEPYARRLGAAFQKINFLRDLKHDMNNLHRVYFPVLKEQPLDEDSKQHILKEIFEDYDFALKGIKKLPSCARLGVYTAYLYYYSLTKRIEKTDAARLLEERIRISNLEKFLLFCRAYVHTKLD